MLTLHTSFRHRIGRISRKTRFYSCHLIEFHVLPGTAHKAAATFVVHFVNSTMYVDPSPLLRPASSETLAASSDLRVVAPQTTACDVRLPFLFPSFLLLLLLCVPLPARCGPPRRGLLSRFPRSCFRESSRRDVLMRIAPPRAVDERLPPPSPPPPSPSHRRPHRPSPPPSPPPPPQRARDETIRDVRSSGIRAGYIDTCAHLTVLKFAV